MGSLNMQTKLTQFLILPNAALLLAVACFGSLAFALTMQFGFDVQPCELCLWQRMPFVSAGVLALLCLVARPYARWFLGLAALLLLANSGLAVFHSGVERHWWEWVSACTGSALSRVNSIEDLRQQLLATPVVRCDKISWSIFGLTMANINIVFSAALALFAAMASKRT